MKEGRSPFKILTGTPTGKRPLGRPRRRCEDNIRTNLKETVINTMNWVDWAQDRDYWRTLVNAGSISHGVSEILLASLTNDDLQENEKPPGIEEALIFY